MSRPTIQTAVRSHTPLPHNESRRHLDLTRRSAGLFFAEPRLVQAARRYEQIVRRRAQSAEVLRRDRADSPWAGARRCAPTPGAQRPYRRTDGQSWKRGGCGDCGRSESIAQPVISRRQLRPGWRGAFLCFVRQHCAITSGLCAIGESVVKISQTHNYRDGTIVFQFFDEARIFTARSRRWFDSPTSGGRAPSVSRFFDLTPMILRQSGSYHVASAGLHACPAPAAQ
jgi:hypothetical protein